MPGSQSKDDGAPVGNSGEQSNSRKPTAADSTTSSTNGPPPVGSLGNLRAPTELGQYERKESTTSWTSPALRHVKAHPGIVRTRRRALMAVQRISTPAAIQEEREIYQYMSSGTSNEGGGKMNSSSTDPTKTEDGWNKSRMTYCTSFAYRGMEILVGTAHQKCFLLCPRTKLVLQTLDPPPPSTLSSPTQQHPSPIISLRTHEATGQIVLVTADGTLVSYAPKPSDPLQVNFGRFHWYTGPTVNCARIFYNDSQSRARFTPARSKHGLEVSVANDFKILLVHRDQLAVLDAKPELREAEMLWTTCLPSPIVTAQLSGDAQSIAVVLKSNTLDIDAADADGVHTLERDWEDGGSSGRDKSNNVSAHSSTSSSVNASNSLHRSSTEETKDRETDPSASVGVIYKPGPFLVHSAPVVRLAFRGKGRETSNPPPSDGPNEVDEIPGNDLLLTVSKDNTAQIFGQSNWKPLTEWTMTPKTRVDWITGTAAMTLGDLEGRSISSQRKRGSTSASSSRRPSSNDLVGETNEVPDTTNRHSHFATIPTHTTPVSKAGAWICEINCQGQYPSMRLSRLTYLKRGADDLSPTLFESFTGHLPANAIYEDLLLGKEEDPSTLSVEGLWPIWNPFVADPTPASDNAPSHETLRGSAMAFLGLSSAHHAVGPGGTFFGDPQLIGTQCPPTELRLTMSHPVSGSLTVIEVPLYGDKSLTSLELGRPMHSVWALNEIHTPEGTATSSHDILDMESTKHGDGRLVAKLHPNNVIRVTWRQPGTGTMLPSAWHPKDIAMPNVADLLSNTKRMNDESLMPPPLALRPFKLPQEFEDANDPFVMLIWWPDSGNVGSPPTLLALTKSGCAVAFEVVTPLVSTVAGSDPSSASQSSKDTSASTSSTSDTVYEQGFSEYEVYIVPDPDLGLGLRLESLDDGQPAIAGSFKKNPKTGGILPAEKTGMITLGDELLTANGVLLEDKPFDEIIGCVRELGASSGPDNPMRLRFRRKGPSLRSRSNSGTSDGSNRRTVEQMFRLSSQELAQRRPFQNGSVQRSSGASRTSTRNAGGCSIVCSFRRPIPGAAQVMNSGDFRRNILLLEASTGGTDDDDCLVALMCCADGRHVVFSVLSLQGTDQYNSSSSKSRHLHTFTSEDDIDSINFVDRQLSCYFILVLERSARVRLLVANLDFVSTNHSIRSFDLSQLCSKTPSDLVLKAHSVELIATFEKDSSNPEPLKIWSSKLNPGCDLGGLESSEAGEGGHNFNYVHSVIRIDVEPQSNGTSESNVVDFRFVSSGYLNPFPWFLVYGLHGTTLHHRPGGSDEWIPLAVINYTSVPGSLSLNIDHGQSPTLFGRHVHLMDAYPHLDAAFRSALPSSEGDSFLRSDWHPESLLASVCLNGEGADAAVTSKLPGFFTWLSTEIASIEDHHVDSPILCAPLLALEENRKGPVQNHSSQDIMQAIKTKDDEPEEIVRMKELQTLLMEAAKDSTRQLYIESQSKKQNQSTQSALPPMLRASSSDDLSLLWAIGELVVSPPDLKYLDHSGQLFLFSSCLFNILKTLDESKKDTKPAKFVAPTVLRKEASSRTKISDSPETDTQVSSGACLAALMSNSQERLVEWARKTYVKMDWHQLRSIRMPFWLRSDKSLARISEEIGQSIFREKRDVMECALFFIIARKLKTLRNLAATDRSDSGQKFFNFLTSHDFSSDRGRRAAEKNAFSLLRKCRYRVASAFFLLAEPPALQSSLETILTKLHDFDLAFMVARLMESKELDSTNGLRLGFSGSGFGGGGGYAGAGTEGPTSASPDSVKYDQWSPTLGTGTRKLLVERLFKLSSNDNALSALQLLWLKKPEEASWWLPGFIISSHASGTGFRVVDDLNSRLSEKLKERDDLLKTGAIAKANAIIDFVSIPFLQRIMNVSLRSRYAGCLLVCDQLISRGVEVPSLWKVMVDLKESGDKPSNEKETSPGLQKPTDHVSSSIFDGFDVPQVAVTKPPKLDVQSSVFDDFDVAPKQAEVKSSIFDGFDVPRPAPRTAPQAEMQSSIFDGFDVPKRVPQASTGEMQSSIFDDFAVPNAPSASSKSMSSLASPHMNGEINRESDDTPPACDIDISIPANPTPEIWNLWKDRVVLLSITRRLIREVASIVSSFHGDPLQVSIEDFYLQNRTFLPATASEVLQIPCDSHRILHRTKESLMHLTSVSGVNKTTLVSSAVNLLGVQSNHYRTLLSVVLYSVIDRFDLAESMIMSAAGSLVRQSGAFALAFDDSCQRRQTRFQASSIQARRLSARVSWQLEMCLWLNRSGLIPLSGLAFKEAIVSVRLGVLSASWNRSPEAIEALLRCEPDAIIDEDEGMHLWSCLKHIGETSFDKSKKASSGGWEFFVDCRRSEATKILRESPTGSFIIRPHPNDHGVFTLSFKTNLVPGDESGILDVDTQDRSLEGADGDAQGRPPRQSSKSVKKDDIVQHAIIRLSDSGFRCGSFGPFTSLLDLLESVSESLPFELRFDLPPMNRAIREEGSQPSPNALLFRRLTLSQTDSMDPVRRDNDNEGNAGISNDRVTHEMEPSERNRCFGSFLDLLLLSKIRRQLTGVAIVGYNDNAADAENRSDRTRNDQSHYSTTQVASWIVGPLLGWCRSLEVRAVYELAPSVASLWKMLGEKSKAMMDVLEQSIEITLGPHAGNSSDSGDYILRSMIQRNSGVDFSTLRLVDGGDCSMVVLFSKNEAIQWLVSSGTELSEADASHRLARMERERVIEPIDFSRLPLKQRPADLDEGVRYRFVDPWEVEAVNSREGETSSASLGRQHFLGFSLGRIALACESDFRMLGGIPLLELWMSTSGGVVLSRALAAVHPPWERSSGGDLQVRGGVLAEPEPFANSIRQHLYRNALFQRLELPQRFLALVQVELLDLKNLTSPGGALAMSVYSLLRLKRRGSSGVLSNKTRTLDTASTSPVRLGKPTGVGPNAPASWGSVVRFRYPLPDETSVDGTSFDSDREALFKGPPSVLQITVYEKKLLVDHALGTADVDMDGLFAGGQVEEWVPLRSEKHGIHWFTRIRLTLRFELMCLASRELKDLSSTAPSVGLQRIENLCQAGGTAAHEDQRRSMSSPDLLQYLESMVY